MSDQTWPQDNIDKGTGEGGNPEASQADDRRAARRVGI